MDFITISIDNTTARIKSPISDSIKQILSDECSFRVQGAEHSALFKKRRWDGYKRLYKSRYNTFPVGLLHRIQSKLLCLGYETIVEDNSTRSVHGSPLDMSSILEPRWYQFSAAQAAIDAKRSIVRIATGGGKTPVACIITAQLNTPTLFLVHTKDLLRQAREAYSEFMNYDCGQIGDGVLDVRDITVGTIQTVARILGTHYKKDSYSEEDENDDTDINGKEQVLRRFIDSVGLLIQDEVHRVASDSAFEVASLVRNAEHYVGFSASPWRDDGADIMLEAAYGHQVFRMSASELIDMNYLMQPTINVRTVTGAPVHGTYDQIYKQWVVENEANNEIVVQDAVDLYNQHRISMILVKQIKHGQILSAMLKREGIPHEFLQGNDSSTVRGDAIREMRNRNLKCLIATTIADEGLDIKPLDSILLAGRGKSSVRALQRVGRTLRLYDKPLPIVREYHDKCRYLEDHFNCRLRMYQTEPRFIINRG